MPNALLYPAPPFDKPATSAGVPRTARQGEVAGRKASGMVPKDCGGWWLLRTNRTEAQVNLDFTLHPSRELL